MLELNNKKIFVIAGVIVVLALIVAVVGVFILGIGGTGYVGDTSGNSNNGLLGRYVAEASDTQNAYIEFSDKNKIEMCTGMITFQGTYTLKGNQLDIEWDMSAFGAMEPLVRYGTVRDDKQEIVYEGATFTKR